MSDLSRGSLRQVRVVEFATNERGTFGESNELDMLSSLACLGIVYKVRVMEFVMERQA